MANGRGSKKDTNWRDGEAFMMLPISVLISPAYIGLSDKAKSLLVLMSMQHSRSSPNNGRLICTKKYMSKWGWSSSDKLARAKRELLDAGFLYETVKGHRPNKASWYALTFFTLSKQPGYDYGAENGFQRSAYKNAHFSPVCGTAQRTIAPPLGVKAISIAPTHGTVKASSETSSTPPGGPLLDKPSDERTNERDNEQLQLQNST